VVQVDIELGDFMDFPQSVRARAYEVHRSFLTIPPPSAPSPSPGPAHYLVARDHRLPALRDVHLLVNVLHSDVLVSARSLALKRE
jgi:hypothetical protein